MPGDGRIPLCVVIGAATPLAGDAVVLVGANPTAGPAAVLRHAGSAAAAQAGACACCRRPSDLVTVLRRLVIERARGEIDFARVVVAVDAAERARLRDDLAGDPLISARFALSE